MTIKTRSIVAVLVTLLATVLIGPVPTHAAAGAAAVAQCGGNLPFGRVATCAAITGAEKDTFRITTTVDDDLLFTSMGRSAGDWVTAQVLGLDGVAICNVSTESGTCRLGAAGVYRLKLSLIYGTGTGNYTISVQSLKTPSNCKALGTGFFSFTSPGVDASLVQGSADRCMSFDQPQGSVLYPAVFSYEGSAYMQGAIYDAQGQSLCPVNGGSNCTLTSAGPYRLFFHDYYGGALTATVRMPRISAPTPAGCPILRVTPFGAQETYPTLTAPVGFANCQRVRATVAGNVNIRYSPSQGVNWTLYSPTGAVVCGDYANLRNCPVPAAGDYALVTQNRSDFGQPVTYQNAVTSLYANAGCAPLTTPKWNQDAIVVHQTAGPQVNCQPFQGTAGDRIVVYRAPESYNDLYAELLDSTGAIVCPGYSSQDGCVLPTTGRYRVVSHLGTWDAETPDATYKLQVRRLNAPQGCPTVSPGAYNAAPAGALGSIRCRILDIATPGVYTIKPVDDENYQNYFALYHADGTRAESCGTVACTISTAGKYTLVVGGNGVNQVLDTDFQYALALLPAKATGCPGIATDPLALARHDGQFAAAGQYDCVQLDAAAGSKVALLQPTGSTGAGRPSGVVYDADGNYVCESPYPLRQESCELVGTAPFSYVYSAPDGAAAGPYSMQVLRVSGDSGCTVLPQATPTTVTSSAATYTACFSIPADQHAAKEIVTYQVTAGTGTASVALYNASGFRYCGSMLFEGTTRTMTCTLPAGAYTLLVQTAAADGAVQVSRQAAP